MKLRLKTHLIETLLFLFGVSVIGSPLLIAQEKMESITLSEALNLALQKNPALASAKDQRRASQSMVWEARSGFLPRLSASASYTQHQEPNIILPIHEMGVFPPLDDQILDASLQLQAPLFNGGRTAANVGLAKASLRESEAQEDLTQFNIMEGIGQIFIQARQLADNERLVAQRIKSLRERYREMSLLLQEGRVSPADLALVTSSIEAARADSAHIEGQRAELGYRLGRLLGIEKPLLPEIAQIDTADADVQPNPFIFIPDTAEIKGPLLSKSEARLERAKAFKSLASRSFLPELSGFAVYNYRSGSDLDLIGEWAAGLTLRIPLFEGGRRIASLQAAKASLSAAEEGMRMVEQEQNSELQIALEHWKSAQRRREYISSAVVNKAKSVAAQQQMYQDGRISLSELLVQETELLQLQLQERALAYTEILAILSYHTTAGKLTIEKANDIVRSIL